MARSLIFDIFAVDRASRVFEHVGNKVEGTGKKFGMFGEMVTKGLAMGGVAAGVFAVEAVHMAADFDTSILRLQTTAGESAANLKMVGDGILTMAGQVGYSSEELAKGMYTVESAGYHGAAALKVLEASAKGAKVENADLTVVTDAVSSLLVDYHLKADQAARVTNVLTAAVGHGKTTFEGLASALPNVAAAGASAHISMEELAAAIATMTMHGTDAAKAGTYLRQVIGQLEGPSAKARKVMHGLGIDANQLGLTLSSGTGHGLADAIQMVDDAIKKHMTPAGLVAIETFKKSKGGVSDYQKVLANLPPSFVTTFGALSEMVGGVKSLQGFLQLGGENLKTYRGNVAAVRQQVKAGGKDVEGFALQQRTLNGRLDDAKAAFGAVAIKVGHDLMPAATKIVLKFAQFGNWLDTVGIPALSSFGGWVKKNSDWLKPLAQFVALVIVGFKAWKLATEAMTAAQILLNIALDANPIGLVIIAIAALAVGFKLAWDHSQTFRKIMVDGFQAILWVVGKLLEGWKLLFEALSHVPGFEWAKTAAKVVGDAATKVQDLSDSLNKIKSPPPIVFTVTANFSPSAQKALAVANATNKVSHIPGHWRGTDYAPGGWSWVGEHGPELVKLPTGSRVLNNEQSMGAGSSTSSDGGGGDVHIHVNGLMVGTAKEMGREVATMLNAYMRGNGAKPLFA